jgi:hypothetical protein
MNKYNDLWMEDNNLTKETINEMRNSLISFIENSETKTCVMIAKDAIWFTIVSDILYNYNFEQKGFFITVYK